jgi:hypothetical protein
MAPGTGLVAHFALTRKISQLSFSGLRNSSFLMGIQPTLEEE